MPAKGEIKGNTVDEVEVVNGVITVKVNNKVDATGNLLALSPSAASGSVTWSCKPPTGATGINAKYLPTECRN